MTNIKCRWSKPYCSYHNQHTRLVHSEYWRCDDGLHCVEGEYCKPPDAKVVNPQCVYCEYDTGEFEKTVKRYEYADGILTVAGKTYLESEIDYLEIDGRILVEPQESEDKYADKKCTYKETGCGSCKRQLDCPIEADTAERTDT